MDDEDSSPLNKRSRSLPGGAIGSGIASAILRRASASSELTMERDPPAFDNAGTGGAPASPLEESDVF